MSLSPLHKCAEPGCRTLIRGEARCPAHQLKRTRKTATDPFYLSPAWRKLRDAFIEANPLCAACLEHGRTEPAYIVDHVIERKDDPSLELEWSNLRGLCLSHHNSKTRQEAVRRKRMVG